MVRRKDLGRTPVADELFDVVQIGYGPVSKVLAKMLARRGWTVGVFERFPAPYVLPRAVCIDHELYRVLHASGFAHEVEQVASPAPRYRWFNADWKTLLEIDWTAEAVSGGSEVNFVHQPTLEASFDTALKHERNVTLGLGWEAMGFAQDEDGVTVELRHHDSATTRVVRCRYLIGVDGANSFVRRSLGIGQEDLGFEADWLVVDMVLQQGITPDTLGIPPCGQYCNPTQPTTIVPGGILPDGRICRRWEFMRLPGETREAMEKPERVWELLGRWIRPDQAELVRHTIYTFRSLIADQWRVGRVLLAGDAAHVMPPFMGQGMCSGMRDAWNLTWKLDLVMREEAEATLLDSYMTERRPHVVDVTRLAIYLGRIICIPDPDEAAQRDAAFLNGSAEPPPPFPALVDGLLRRDGTALATGAGVLAPHTRVTWRDRTGRWDEVVGLGWRVVSQGDADAVLSAGQRAFLDRIGALRVDLSQATDHDDKFAPFLRQYGLAAMIVRPDFYLFGGATTLADLPATVRALRDALATCGVHAAELETAS
jgi:2-polyprenyl-6-methoxyphenol hydroxylase-like FAD-dependent oxidoreductase